MNAATNNKHTQSELSLYHDND